MRNSKGRSMKHARLFGCEDQRSQDHKKIVQERMEGNRFVIREVPIHRLFNGGQCANNGSGDLSGFSKGKNFSAGMNVMDYDTPELVVFIQEDPQQFVKDISIDRVVSPEGKSLPEDCDLDHNVICLIDPNMKRRTNSNLGTMEAMSTISKGSECGFQHPSIKDTMKNYDCGNLKMGDGLELDLGGKFSNDHHTKRTSQTLRDVFRNDAEFSRSSKNWQMNSYLGTTGSRGELPHCACAYCAQFTNTTSMSRPEILGNSQSIIDSGKRQVQVDYPEDISSCALGPLSGPISYTGPAATSSSTSHHQSNDSISSTHSFAFPILPAEWNGSPVRMLEADKRQSRKQFWRKMWRFPCFKCC